MDIIDKLTEVFKEFPGIGERQARRFVYFLMSRTPAYGENLSSLISELKKEVTQCTECFRFFIVNRKQDRLCDICGSSNADSSILMIVEKDSDLESVKKSRVYNGKYFVLGGLVPIVEKNTKSRVRIEELKEKIQRGSEARPNMLGLASLKEIILAFSLSPQGDHTDTYVREQIKEITEKRNIRVSS